MEETINTPIQRPIRRRKSRQQIFKENGLPFWILLGAIVVILLLIIGACTRNNEAQQTAQMLLEVL